MEVEIRATLQNPQSFIKNLVGRGAVFVKKKTLTDYYFGSLELYEKLGHSFWLRLRQEEKNITLAYKGPTKNDGIYEEYEQEFQNLELGITILKKCGLENPITVTKERTTYQFKDYSILIDDFGPERGTYVEIEEITNEPNRNDMLTYLKELGVSESDIFYKGFITKFLNDMNSPYAKWVTG